MYHSSTGLETPGLMVYKSKSSDLKYLSEITSVFPHDIADNDADFTLIPLPTDYKGPVYTCPTRETVSQLSRQCKLHISVSYRGEDDPPVSIMKTTYDLYKNPLLRFSVSPFISGLSMLGNLNKEVLRDRELVIDDIWVEFSPTRFSYSYGCNNKYKIQDGVSLFQNFGFSSETDELFRQMGDGKSVLHLDEFSSTFSKHFETRHLINVPTSSICYGLTDLEYQMFTQWMSGIRIDIFNSSSVDGDPWFTLESSDLTTILTWCLLLPDMFFFDYEWFNNDLSYNILLHLQNGSHHEIQCSHINELGIHRNLFYTITSALKYTMNGEL